MELDNNFHGGTKMETTQESKGTSKVFQLIVIAVVAAIVLKAFSVGMLIVGVCGIVVGAALAKGGKS